jgi:hypothetical protein
MKRAWKAVLAGLFVAAIALPAGADSQGPETFTGFGVENPLTAATATANGWTYTGGSQYDVATTGSALRISNRNMSGSFGDWVFSKPLTTAATEDGLQTFTADFDISSTSSTLQPGLQISVAPQTAGGARMSFLKFIDSPADTNGPGGIDVQFADYANDGVNGRQITIANDLTRNGFHVTIVLDLYPGPHNDVAQVYINHGPPLVPASGGIQGFYAPVDNPATVNKAKAGQTIPVKFTLNAEPATTWEDYYRFNCESNVPCPAQGEWGTRQVDSLIFQARGADGSTNPNIAPGGGFLIDNVTTSSTDTLALPTGATGDPSLLGPNPFTAMTDNCDPNDTTDAIETYTPGASGLTYNASTGIWHYNWQTKNQYAGNCVELTLNLTGDNALFKFTK